jgi:DNA polymerase-3 subunit delta'
VWPIYGHRWAVELLARSVETQRLSHAYLFVGPAQIGKRTLAKMFTQAILCDAERTPCGACRACRLVGADRHPDVHVVDPEKGSIKIEAIRNMQHAVALSPVEGRYRVCVISQFDRATPSAANALLKTLEEPPSTVILLLTANRAESLLPTIVSRCQVFGLRPLPLAQIVAALQSRGLDEDQARVLGHLAQGRIGWALAAAQDERVLEQRDQVLESIVAAAHGSYTERFAWVEALSKRPDQVPDTLDTLTSWWRDVLLLTSSSTTPITNVDQEAVLVEWAVRHDVDTAQRALRAIRDTAWRLERNANLRLALEVLMLDLPSSAWN